jgi:hypothetical protein
MTFTNAEVRFLSEGRTVRGRGWASLDHATIRNCPAHIRTRILEYRAKALGDEFAEFQEEQKRLANPNSEYRASDEALVKARRRRLLDIASSL